MQVHIDTATGAESIECTKPERSTMRKAAVLFHVIARHGAHLSIMDGPETETALKWIDTIVEHFCSEPVAAVTPESIADFGEKFEALAHHEPLPPISEEDCDTVILVNRWEASALADDSLTDGERSTIRAKCEARRAAIRSTRGDKANVEPAMTG